MHNILQPFLKEIESHFDAKAISNIQKIQSLWSNYGGIYRLVLQGAEIPSIVVKCITLDKKRSHPRGWSTNLSHQRKLKSYEIETYWYQHYADSLPLSAKVPQLLYETKKDALQVLVLEDLSLNYPTLKDHCNYNEAKTVVEWLAAFHAHFLNSSAKGLWETGSYWHLETRPDEWQAMKDSSLKENAELLDAALKSAKFQTIIHGDAKVANFCFGKDDTVAAVDFQYVGKGVGVKDLAYFLGSCFTDKECDLYESNLLDYYFKQLRKGTSNLSVTEQAQLEKEWRDLYPLAWADFNRFLLGWLPGHRKLHPHALSKNEEALEYLNLKEG